MHLLHQMSHDLTCFVLSCLLRHHVGWDSVRELNLKLLVLHESASHNAGNLLEVLEHCETRFFLFAGHELLDVVV